jgi:undecaprenyl-diphosphatase
MDIVYGDGMSVLEGIILGIVQGLTEFLPVSSTGHLEVTQSLMRLEGADHVSLDIFLHLATVIAVLFFFRRDIASIFRDLLKPGTPDARRGAIYLISMIILGIFSTAVVYFVFKKTFEQFFGAPKLIAYAFFFTAIILAFVSFRKEGSMAEGGLRWWHALLIGVAQGIAITPGVSRSGMTICAALLIGLASLSAFRFSFLLSIPTIIIAWIYDIVSKPDVFSNIGSFDALLLGSIAAFFTALFAIFLLKGAVLKHKLWIFSLYLVPAGIFALFYNFS